MEENVTEPEQSEPDTRADDLFVVGEPEPEPGPYAGSCTSQGRNPKDPGSWLPRACTRGAHTGLHVAAGPGPVGTPVGGPIVLAAWT